MRLPIIAAAIALSTALTGCVKPIESKLVPLTAKQEAAMKEKVSRQLKDPMSAQFRNLRQVVTTKEDGTTSTEACGEVNAKNSFGGYVGFTTFRGYFRGDEFAVLGIASPEHEWLYSSACKPIPINN